MSEEGKPTAPGALDACLCARLSGWASSGSSVRVHVDGRPAGEARADRRRLTPLSSTARGGFLLDPPPGLFDGAEHLLEAFDAETGAPLEGGRVLFRSQAATGRVDGLEGRMVTGRVRDPHAPERVVEVAALAGDEVVATAVAGPTPITDAEGHHFRLRLPEALLRTGAAFIQVGVIGSDVRLAGGPVVLPALPVAPLTPRPRAPRPLTLAIKIAAPDMRVAHEWGDYHFAVAVGAALHKRGWIVRVDCGDAWDRTGDDVTLTLRGRHRYRPDPAAVNLLWVISHPERVGRNETDDFDRIFVAAAPYARKLARLAGKSVEVLHQATDPVVFTGADPIQPPAPLLFVGNSRRENRRMPRWCVEKNLDVAVYGTLWDGVIPARLVRGAHVPNAELGRWYAGAAVVLNDHWDTMLGEGFLSNRLFDASAAGGFIITDPVAGLAEVFGDSVETAADSAELAAKVKRYLAEPALAKAKAQAARKIVLGAHTFEHRAEVLERAAHDLLRAKGKL